MSKLVKPLPKASILDSSTDVTKLSKSKIVPFRRTLKENFTNTKLFFGVELEVEIKALEKYGSTWHDHNEYHRIMNSTVDNCQYDFRRTAVLKSECSIRYGFEIVTVPATLDYHRTKLWNRFFKNTAKLVKSWDTGRCGLHIHFSRDAVDDISLARVIYFYNEPCNSKFLTKIAGRSVQERTTWCSQRKKIITVNEEGEMVKRTIGERGAISLSRRNNGKSVEVRIFRGNAKRAGVMRALEFVAATIDFGRATTNKNLTTPDFIAWFDSGDNKVKYPHLARYLKFLKYIKPQHKLKPVNETAQTG